MIYTIRNWMISVLELFFIVRSATSSAAPPAYQIRSPTQLQIPSKRTFFDFCAQVQALPSTTVRSAAFANLLHYPPKVLAGVHQISSFTRNDHTLPNSPLCKSITRRRWPLRQSLVLLVFQLSFSLLPNSCRHPKHPYSCPLTPFLLYLYRNLCCISSSRLHPLSLYNLTKLLQARKGCPTSAAPMTCKLLDLNQLVPHAPVSHTLPKVSVSTTPFAIDFPSM